MGITAETPSLSALLPLKLTGRHYADNLARLDLLFSSLLHLGAPGWLDEMVIVVPADEAQIVRRYLACWPELPVRLVVEEPHFPAFGRYTRPWQVRPWQRQQIIKLNAPALTTADFVLVLDPDVIAVRPLRRDLLVPDGRAVLEPEARSVHRRWWRDSAALLKVDPALDQPGMNVTPAVLARDVLAEAQERLEVVGGRPWMDVLLTSYCDWTEYSLYLLAAERARMVERVHVWADDPAAPAHLQVAPELSIWEAAATSRANLERLFTADDPGLFAVVQSNTRLAPRELALVAAEHFPVRSVPAELPRSTGRRSKLDERICTASRLAGQCVYRWRRGLHRA